MNLTKVNLNLIPIYKMHGESTPSLDQIIKPEIENIHHFRFIPRPHPPISRKKYLEFASSASKPKKSR